jgi:hypothetical protein
MNAVMIIATAWPALLLLVGLLIGRRLLKADRHDEERRCVEAAGVCGVQHDVTGGSASQGSSLAAAGRRDSALSTGCPSEAVDPDY